MNWRLVFIFFLIIISIPSFAEVYQAPSTEPTDEETLVLEWLNRCRMNPAREPGIILAKGKGDLEVNWTEFEKGMKALKPAPPLAFDLRLLDASRKHAHYFILNNVHFGEEKKGAPGFTGAQLPDRLQAAGYRGNGRMESSDHGSNLWRFHLTALVEPPGKPGKRGISRIVTDTGFRDAGLGILQNRGEYMLAREFGASDAPRLACGVAYIDVNKNEFYDLKESASAVFITASDGSSISTWRSGAYTLTLRSTSAVTLTAEFAGQKLSQKFPAGAESIKFDLNITAETMNKHVDQLIAAVSALPADSRSA